MEKKYQNKFNHEKLREVRISHGLSLELVADVLGISKCYLSCIERGKRGLQFGFAADLCDFYNIDLVDLKVR